MSEPQSLLHDAARDARMSEKARGAIRAELEGATRDGVIAPPRGLDESWEELCHGRDVLSLMRERDALRLASKSALAHAEGLRMDTPEDQRIVDKLIETIKMALL